MKTRKDSTYSFLFAYVAAAASAIPHFYELEPGANDLFTDSSDPEYAVLFMIWHPNNTGKTLKKNRIKQQM